MSSSTLEPFMDEPTRQMMKVCTKCGKSKPATPEYFHRHGGNKDGWAYWCKECKKDQYDNEGGKEIRYKNSHKNPHRSVFVKLRARVKREGKYKFLLGGDGTPEAKAWIGYLKTITHCPDCAKDLVWLSVVKNNPDSASFDRIDPGGDYTKENVRIVCVHCNSRKRDSPVDEWVGLLEARIRKGIIACVDEALVQFLSESKDLN
jgi:hypothetical protein